MIRNVIVSAALVVGSFALTQSAVAAENFNTGMVNSFENLFGVTKGKRRNHTTGLCFTGTLVPHDSGIAGDSTSPIFRQVSTVLGRLSHKGGKNNRPDNKPGLHGLALLIKTPSGAEHRMSMNTEDFFPVSTPEAFRQVLIAKKAGKVAVKALLKTDPEFAAYKAHMSSKEQVVRPYEAMTFNSVNAFYLVNANNQKHAVRWAFKPAFEAKIVVDTAPVFLQKNLQENVNNGVVAWDMVFTYANPDDDVNNPAKPWTGARKEINAARLYVSGVGQTDACNEVNFDPLVVSDGFAPSDDPTLMVRSPTYAISLGRRLSE